MITEFSSSNHAKVNSQIKLEDSWKNKLEDEFNLEYLKNLRDFLIAEKTAGKTIYPESNHIFAALNTTPFDDVKVVIIGQDPYHGPNQAHGLSFSVKPSIPHPPSLMNIFKELKQDVGISKKSGDGYLMGWATQGVLLLNAVLTVEAGKANSHQGRGWEIFTDKIVHLINDLRENIVFILWGSYAQKKGAFIDRKKHYVIESPHPSPLSAHRGFLGSKPFSKINTYLESKNKKPIDWSL